MSEHYTVEPPDLLEPGTATANRRDDPEYIDCGHYYEVYVDDFPLGIAYKAGYSYSGTASIGDKAYGAEGEAKERQSVQRMREELDELCES